MAKSDARPAICRLCGTTSKTAHYITRRLPNLIEWIRVCMACKIADWKGAKNDN